MSHTLKIEILSYWHPGTGQGAGSQLDAITHRNSSGLPSLPGRTVKGLLRDALNRWEHLCNNDLPEPTTTEQLFGPIGAEGAETWPGLLRCSDATLQPADIAYLNYNPALIAALYRSHITTAIDHDSGTAQEKSLRGIELVVPLTLYAALESISEAHHTNLLKTWHQQLKVALPLVQAVGGHRSRGLGRATLTLEAT